MTRYIAEYKMTKRWKFISDHGDKDIAIINAEVFTKSRGKITRVRYGKEIISVINPEIKEN